jgi:hypothetical protein
MMKPGWSEGEREVRDLPSGEICTAHGRGPIVVSFIGDRSVLQCIVLQSLQNESTCPYLTG